MCRTANGSDINFTSEYYLNQIKDVVSGKMSELDLDRDIRSKAQKDGRGNIAPCTIILPTIAMEVKESLSKDISKEELVNQFMNKLSETIDKAKDGLIIRYNLITSQNPKSATFMWENGTMVGYKDDIGPESAIKHGTLAIGKIGIAETLQILIGTNQLSDEGMELAKRIDNLYKTKCNEFKHKYNLNFGVYNTPKYMWAA